MQNLSKFQVIDLAKELLDGCLLKLGAWQMMEEENERKEGRIGV